jgi:hypothetical protein
VSTKLLEKEGNRKGQAQYFPACYQSKMRYLRLVGRPNVEELTVAAASN